MRARACTCVCVRAEWEKMTHEVTKAVCERNRVKGFVSGVLWVRCWCYGDTTCGGCIRGDTVRLVVDIHRHGVTVAHRLLTHQITLGNVLTALTLTRKMKKTK